jgi:hypothetical protein
VVGGVDWVIRVHESLHILSVGAHFECEVLVIEECRGLRNFTSQMTKSDQASPHVVRALSTPPSL